MLQLGWCSSCNYLLENEVASEPEAQANEKDIAARSGFSL